MRDIQKIEDVKLFVDCFYQKVRNNELLGPIFNERIADKWTEHLEKMYRFWQTLLLEEHTYAGRPFPPHATMPLVKEHFDTWVELFLGTIDELFAGEKANEAKLRAGMIAQTFYYKIESLKSGASHSLL